MKGLPNGERRRVSIARELVMRPHIMFIDEPLYHLDRLGNRFLHISDNFLMSCSVKLLHLLGNTQLEFASLSFFRMVVHLD